MCALLCLPAVVVVVVIFLPVITSRCAAALRVITAGLSESREYPWGVWMRRATSSWEHDEESPTHPWCQCPSVSRHCSDDMVSWPWASVVSLLLLVWNWVETLGRRTVGLVQNGLDMVQYL